MYCTALIRGAPRDCFNENRGYKACVVMHPTAHLSAPTLRAGTIACAPRRSNMVSTRDILTIVLFFIAFAAAQSAPPPTRKSGMTDTTDAASQRPIFPGENPPEHELEAWRVTWMATLREKHLLAYAEKHVPEKPSEYRHKTALAVPHGASEPLQASIALKNAELVQANARLDVAVGRDPARKKRRARRDAANVG